MCSPAVSLVELVERTASELAMFGTGNEDGDNRWRELAGKLAASPSSSDDEPSTPMEDSRKILKIFASNNVSIGSFWSEIFDRKLNPRIKIEKTRLPDLLSLLVSCNQVDFRPEIVIEKLIAGLLENETVWVVSVEELVEVTKAVASSYTQNRRLFAEIANRVTLEINDFNTVQLIEILEAFAKINFTNSDMMRVATKRFVDDFHSIPIEQKVAVADILSQLRFRSDTFFKTLAAQLLHEQSKCESLCSVLVAMQRLKMNSGSSAWWDRQSDYEALSKKSIDEFKPENISRMTAKDLSSCAQIVKKHGDAIMKRMRHLLTLDPLSRSHRYLAVILEALAKTPGPKTVNSTDLRWVAEWLCGNVFILPVHDIATINRAVAKLGFKDHNFHKIWIPYYLERLTDLTKEDIALISENFNAIGMTDTQMGGRHFFYKLGKRFQELTVETNGDKEINERRKFRTLQRIG